MIPALREAFNRNFRPEIYQRFLKDLEASAGAPIAFRVSETPCFLPKALLDQMAEYGRDLVLQLVDNPEYHSASDITVPPQYNVANESPRHTRLNMSTPALSRRFVLKAGAVAMSAVNVSASPSSSSAENQWRPMSLRPWNTAGSS